MQFGWRAEKKWGKTASATAAANDDGGKVQTKIEKSCTNDDEWLNNV